MLDFQDKKARVKILFNSFKHCDQSSEVFIIEQSNSSRICPVKTIREYVKLRPNHTGPFFLHQNLKPVNRKNYSNIVKKSVKYIGLDEDNFNTHSLRIGRATDLAINNYPHELIKRIGRWSSTAYLKYIRIEEFVIPRV